VNRRILLVVALTVALAVGLWWLRREKPTDRFTGFVEGEDRIIRSEVAARVLEVPFREGDVVPADTVVARLDARDVDSRIESRRRELDVLAAETRTQEERVRLTETTWQRDVAARRAAVEQATSAAELAERTFVRERDLAASGASTAQFLDDARARQDQARSALEQAREMLERTVAEETGIAVARQTLEGLHEKRKLVLAQIAELEVTRTKYEVRAPSVATRVETQFIWPGELAQPGGPVVSLLDPQDKYVQVYVPVAELGRFRIGRKVEFELDSTPGQRIPGEVSFVADQASFTPEKIETRSDRLGQVYRAKIRILEGAETVQPGTECDVYFADAADDREERGSARPGS
jgi:HlyD family secretion protein